MRRTTLEVSIVRDAETLELHGGDLQLVLWGEPEYTIEDGQLRLHYVDEPPVQYHLDSEIERPEALDLDIIVDDGDLEFVEAYPQSRPSLPFHVATDDGTVYRVEEIPTDPHLDFDENDDVFAQNLATGAATTLTEDAADRLYVELGYVHPATDDRPFETIGTDDMIDDEALDEMPTL